MWTPSEFRNRSDTELTIGQCPFGSEFALLPMSRSGEFQIGNWWSGQHNMLKFALAGTFVVALAGGACAAETAPAQPQTVLNGAVAALNSTSTGHSVADVKPGEQVTITGDCVANVKSADRLRVMLTPAGDDAGTSRYHVLATEQAIGAAGLNVRVPNLPETANRDFSVRVFRLGEDTPTICNAGIIHVGSSNKHRLG
jgi:hypothetical protein